MPDTFISYSLRYIDFVDLLLNWLLVIIKAGLINSMFHLRPISCRRSYHSIKMADYFLFITDSGLIASKICTLEIEFSIKYSKLLDQKFGKGRRETKT